MEEAEAFVDLRVPAVVVERRVPQSLWLEENWNWRGFERELLLDWLLNRMLLLWLLVTAVAVISAAVTFVTVASGKEDGINAADYYSERLLKLFFKPVSPAVLEAETGWYRSFLLHKPCKAPKPFIASFCDCSFSLTFPFLMSSIGRLT